MADTQAENPAAPAATTEHRLEGLLEHATRIFLTSRTETVEADIALVLKHFRHRLGAEQAVLFLCPAAEGEDTPPRCVVSAAEPEALYQRMQRLYEQHALWCQLVRQSSVRVLPAPEVGQGQHWVLDCFAAQAVVMVPVVGRSADGGCLMFAFDAQRPVLTHSQRQLLSTLAQLCYLMLDRLTVMERLRQSEQLLQRTEQLAAIGSWYQDMSTGRISISPQLARIFAFAEDTRTAVMEDFFRCLHPEDSQRVKRTLAASIRHARITDMTYRIINQRGEQRTLHGIAQVLCDGDGQVIARFGSIQDITEQESRERHLLQAAKVLESTNEGVVITDANGLVEAVNPAFSRITGYREEDVLQHPVAVLKSGRHDQAFYRQMFQQLSEHGRWHGEVWNRRRNGEVYPQWLTITAVQDSQGRIGNYVGVFNDMSVLRRSEQQLEQLSYYDSLTGLPNRSLLIQRLQQALSRAHEGDKVALIAIDLDHFKHINDSLGHPAGDRLLKQFAQRLQPLLRDGATLARQGGDDFVFLLEQVAGREQVASVADDIKQLLYQPFDLGVGQALMIGVSMGITLSPDHGDSVTQLLSNADVAMYQAKQRGRNHYQFYSDEMTRAASDRLELGSQLRHALQLGGQLQLYYQPQVCMQSGQVIGLEALMRWQHPQDGTIPPGRFLPVAEDNGLMPELDTCALTLACQQVAVWQQQGVKPLTVAVNITQPTFVAGGLVETLQLLLQRYHLDAGWLELEITEGALLEPTPAVLDTIAGLKALGVSLAVDDFGTGYSSLAYLHRYKVDKLKIDRSFVIGLDEDDGQVITTTIIQLAKGLGLKVLAEGVECIEQLQFLRANHCETYQGFYFSRPLPAAELQHWLRPVA
ncbi:GGDEF domain-containing protein [Bacterioplanes sanyensis]|uniref:putative bifunctional diguanylate cyclase/phosphodiesterase n=1 Tax=Bacterioplanes sanyensis TaxID=1249553 RepID=UPI001675BCC0|nr:GGDEF domain-containing phosphodiesterase [Bacterioplanes sanyensis]GGY31571.1 GGDEF domain-containing protein [Bacterioplanes sanyensis]